MQPLAQLFRALGDETHLRIVALLAHGELCVCHVQTLLDLEQPIVSRHLGVLRAAGVVAARRDGRWIHYRLRPQTDPARRRSLAALVRGATRDAPLRRRLARVVARRGPAVCA